MRDTYYTSSFLFGAVALLVLGRDYLPGSPLTVWAVSFGVATAVAALAVSLNRVNEQLRKSRRELARQQSDIRFAREVQKALFPKSFPSGSGLEFSAVCIPAQGISGDFYDVLRLPQGRIVFALADISGKGIPAAILMANVHALIRSLSEAYDSIETVCTRLNAHICDVTEPSKFATLFLAEWNPKARSLVYINAGHQEPIIRGCRGNDRLVAGGPPVGLFFEAEYKSGTLHLEADSTLLLFSDGVSEASSPQGEEFGVERLAELVDGWNGGAPQELENRVVDAVREWTDGEMQDDVTVMVVLSGVEATQPDGRGLKT